MSVTVRLPTTVEIIRARMARFRVQSRVLMRGSFRRALPVVSPACLPPGAERAPPPDQGTVARKG
ncbi:hypothetical protein GCM10025871_05110 [Deinococcus metallilatus]|nr:hypothetical protein GCM10025871_05110 [Deinococcus metallilatus]